MQGEHRLKIQERKWKEINGVLHCDWIGSFWLQVEDPHGPKVSHTTIDIEKTYSHPHIPDPCMDFEDRLANMSDAEYERYLRLK